MHVRTTGAAKTPVLFPRYIDSVERDVQPIERVYFCTAFAAYHCSACGAVDIDVGRVVGVEPLAENDHRVSRPKPFFCCDFRSNAEVTVCY